MMKLIQGNLKYNILSCMFFMLFFNACFNNNTDNVEIDDQDSIEKRDEQLCSEDKIEKDTIISLNERLIIIKYPQVDKKNGTFLMLHGWNLKPDEWCENTLICDEALSNGYAVVLPDMGKSNYQTQIFDETRDDYSQTPSLYWLTDTLIPFLQENCLLLEDEDNFIVGLSTGGRGVALVCMELPFLFKAAAALSGDFDQSKMPNDKVHIGFYGSYENNNERWATIDNPVFRIKEMKTPLYLGHGLDDNVTNSEQSQMFFDSLKKYNPHLKVKLHLTEAGHDYEYWNSEVQNILSFFREID